jgi:hypothetical protein
MTRSASLKIQPLNLFNYQLFDGYAIFTSQRPLKTD